MAGKYCPSSDQDDTLTYHSPEVIVNPMCPGETLNSRNNGDAG
jgi:hypothetical protein